MQREKSVKVKEVITALCKLLSVLGVDSVPSGESFRRAKFNKIDVTEEMWTLLNNLLMKGVLLDCCCEGSSHADSDPQVGFVRSALWNCGYGASWVVRPQVGSLRRQVGSRELLLAFGWLLSTGRFLEFLLEEKVLQLEAFAIPSMRPRCAPGGGDSRASAGGRGGAAGPGDLRTLQWQYGKLRLRWRSLMAAQEERARLTHKVLANLSPSCASETSLTEYTSKVGATGLDKELKRVQDLNGILEAYLDWKVLEPLFWCWMDSVIDSKLSEPREENAAYPPLGDKADRRVTSHGDGGREAVKSLEKVLERLQRQLPARRAGRHTVTPQAVQQGQLLATDPGRAEVESTVVNRLRELSLGSTTASRSFIPCLLEPQAGAAAAKPQKGEAGRVHASVVLRQLKEQQVLLQWELELLRQGHREEVQEQANVLDGLIFMPPLKR